MGLWAIILGAFAIICAVVNVLRTFAIVPAIAGVALGAYELYKLIKYGDSKKGMAILGMTLSFIGIILIFIYWIIDVIANAPSY